MIQFFCVTLMMIYVTYLRDFQFLASDIFIVFPLEWFLAMTKPYSKLTHHYPISGLLSFPVLTSIITHTAIVFAFQFGGYHILKNHYNWENICDFDENDSPLPCHENTIYFLISFYQYLALAIAFFVSKPFRQRIYTNWLLMIYLAGVYDLEQRGEIEVEDEEEGEEEEGDEAEDTSVEEETENNEEEANESEAKEDEVEVVSVDDGIIPGGKKMKYYILIIVVVNSVVNIVFEWVFMSLINYCYERREIQRFRKEIENEKMLRESNKDETEIKDVKIYKYQRVYYYDRRKRMKQ